LPLSIWAVAISDIAISRDLQTTDIDAGYWPSKQAKPDRFPRNPWTLEANVAAVARKRPV